MKDQTIVQDLLSVWEKLPEKPSAEQLCAAHPHLIGEVQRGIESLGRANRYLKDISESKPNHPTQIGRYRLIKLLGEGGMGSVYLAEQNDDLHRQVALKIIRPGFDLAQVTARFESERQTLALMNHPNIATVLDAGVIDGRPYFVMEYVEGEPITTFADRERLNLEERLELFIQVCDAIAHAHQKAIIHRDIAAKNVLGFKRDGKIAVKVIDFGIAKALTNGRAEVRTDLTIAGHVVGTYSSMSPEQLSGSADIDTRTDIYSLGVLLYELLSGVRPFNFTNQTSLPEVIKSIQEGKMPRPSTRVMAMGPKAETFAESRSLRLPMLMKILRAELEWIPMKALRKDPARRYQSVTGLRDDIRRYLAKKPLKAGPETIGYKLQKYFVRNRSGVAVAIVGIVAIGLYIASIRAEQARTAAALSAVSAEQQRTHHALNEVQRLFELSEERLKGVQRIDFYLLSVYDLARKEGVPAKVAEEMIRTAIVHLDKMQQETQTDPIMRKNLARAYFRLGDVLGNARLSNLGQTSNALDCYKRSLELLSKLNLENQLDAVERMDLALSYDRLADIEMQLGNLTESMNNYTASQAILQTLNLASPLDEKVTYQLTVRNEKIGELLAFRGEYASAISKFRQALATREKLQTTPSLLWANSCSHLYIATAQLKLRQFTDAIESVREAQKELKLLKAKTPDDPKVVRNESISRLRLAQIYLEMRQLPESWNLLSEDLVARKAAVARDPDDVRADLDLATLLETIGDWHVTSKDPVQAVVTYRECLAVREKHAHARDAQQGRRILLIQSRLARQLQLIGESTPDSAAISDAIQLYQSAIARCEELKKTEILQPYDQPWIDDLLEKLEQCMALQQGE